MKKVLLGGALGLLLINIFILTCELRSYHKPNYNLKVSYPKDRDTGNITNLFIARNFYSLKLTFTPCDKMLKLNSIENITTTASIKKVKLSLNVESNKLKGAAPKGFLFRRRLFLTNFSGTICGWKIESEEVIIDLTRPQIISIKKFIITNKKNTLKGTSTSSFDINHLCLFLKGKRKTPH